MSTAKLDVLGVGNAIVDVLAETDDAFLAAQGIAKGGMTLIDTARAHALYAAMPAGTEAPGGSAGKPMAGNRSRGNTGGRVLIAEIRLAIEVTVRFGDQLAPVDFEIDVHFGGINGFRPFGREQIG